MSQVIAPRPVCENGHRLPQYSPRYARLIQELQSCPICRMQELDEYYGRRDEDNDSD